MQIAKERSDQIKSNNTEEQFGSDDDEIYYDHKNKEDKYIYARNNLISS